MVVSDLLLWRMTNDRLVGTVFVIKHSEIFEGGNCLQTQISLLKIASGMTLVSDGVKWCKKQSLVESLYYKGCMGCCYNSHLYMVACQQVNIFVIYKECPCSWREKYLFSNSDKIGYPMQVEGGALTGELLFPVAPSVRFHGPCWLWEWEEDTRFSIWLSGFGHGILVELKEMRQASLHV